MARRGGRWDWQEWVERASKSGFSFPHFERALACSTHTDWDLIKPRGLITDVEPRLPLRRLIVRYIIITTSTTTRPTRLIDHGRHRRYVRPITTCDLINLHEGDDGQWRILSFKWAMKGPLAALHHDSPRRSV